MRMPRLLLPLAITAMMLVATGAGGADRDDRNKAFPGVKALMDEAEFSAAGLDSLTPEQLKALDAWLLRYTAGDAEVLQGANEAVREAQKEYEVVSRLSADFDGWSGDTLFRLENGQVWRQRLDGRFFYRGPPSPEVRISRNFFGFFKMTLVKEDRAVGVSQVQ